MTVSFVERSKPFISAVLVALVLAMAPAGLLAQGSGSGGQAPGPRPAAAAPGGTLAGFVYVNDMKTPVAGAIVKIRNLADMKEVASTPSDANGMYTLPGIPEGRYVLGVTTGPENFNLDYALYIKSGELGKLSIAIGAGGGQDAGAGSVKKKGFFSSVAGRILVVSAIGVGLYFLLVEPESSPIR